MSGRREPNVEAGAYIEDDPDAWESWVAVLGTYLPQFAALSKHVGSDEGATSILAGTILSVLADRHGLFLRRPLLAVLNDPRTAAVGSEK